MNIHLRALLITFLILCTSITNASENNNIDVMAVPGLLGNDHEGYSEKIISLFKGSTIYKIGTLPIPERPDLGQKRCVQHLDYKIIYDTDICRISGINKRIIIATSQGAATITRWMTQYDHIPRAVIFEGYAASFNQCISHVVETQVPLTKHLPLKYYWLPYLAKMLPYAHGTWFPLWHYNPAEKQPIECLESMPTDLPIIIVHCRQDRLTPYKGALAAYIKLRDTGHKNTYLIAVDVDLKNSDPNNLDLGHIDVLEGEDNTEDFDYLQEILLHHQLLPSKLSNDIQNINSDKRLGAFSLKRGQCALKTLENEEKWVKRFGTCLYAIVLTY